MRPTRRRFWRRFYDQVAFAYDAVLALGDRMGIGSEGLIRRIFISRLPHEPGDLVLDVGCGTATLRAHLPQDVIYIGVDLSRGMLLRAKRNHHKAGEIINLVQADAQALPFRSRIANIALAMGSLQHLVSPSHGLQELQRSSVGSGRVLVIDENHAKSRVLAGTKHDKVTLFDAGEYFIFQS
jgi:ubiquinone/menaquinone biosynthesis C-methylase UbiE